MLGLAPESLAKVGFKFTVTGEGPFEECSECPVQKLCFGPAEGHWEITKLRPVTHPCEVHDGRMQVVELEPTSFESTLLEKQLRGSAASFAPIDCGYAECQNWKLCHPIGLEGRREIVEVHETVDCPMDYQIKRVTLR